jgi:hypothetical protein
MLYQSIGILEAMTNAVLMAELDTHQKMVEKT